MPKRNRSPPLPSCYSTDRPLEEDPGKQKGCHDCVDDDSFISHVEHIDGRRFWCDRFYLNSEEPSSSSVAEETDKCDCGSLQPPSTFPLVDFVNRSLDLKAAVFGTFNIHPEWFRESFPRFGAKRNRAKDDKRQSGDEIGRSERSVDNQMVPTFIFHGHRGLEKALATRVKQADATEYITDEEENEGNQADTGNRKLNSLLSIEQSDKFKFFLPVTSKATETARYFVGNPDLQLCQVHCSWEKKTISYDSTTSALVSSDKENSKNDEKHNSKTTRETKMGVHHPKFLLLFEQSGDLVVIVTTSNLTPSNKSTVEGSWVQRFRRRNRRNVHANREMHCESDLPKQQNLGENDFGPVLQDFLVQLSEAAAAGTQQSRKSKKPSVPLANNNGDKSGINESDRKNSNHLEKFLMKHIGLKSLSEFSSLYHFETAKVYLVPIIPGDYKYDPLDKSTMDGKNEKSRTTCHYGRQRVRYVLDKLATSAPKISKKTQDKSKSDRLLLQPTSLGTDWSRSQFASMVREYMGYYGSDYKVNTPNTVSINDVSARKTVHKKRKTSHDCSYHRDDFWVCRQADIVWPSDRFMINVAKESSERNTNIISPLQAASTITHEDGHESSTRTTVMNSFVFNSSRTFNGCDHEFVARMTKYQSNTPCQLNPSQKYHNKTSKDNCDDSNTNEPPVAKAPHFKSIARLFQNHVAMQKRDVPPANAYFSWFLLTSACLSTGAQGATVDVVHNEGESIGKANSGSPSTLSSSSVATMVTYRNFELGVLFASHLPKQPKKMKSSKTTDLLQEYKKQRRSIVYCFRPNRCSCGDKKTAGESLAPQLVHLPVPYNVRPESYFSERNQENEDDEDDDADSVMNENPFFHEVSDESRCIGNMLSTPFGRRERNVMEM